MSTIIGYGCMQYNNNIQSFLIKEYSVDNITAGYYIAMQFLIQLPLTPIIGFFSGKNGGKQSTICIYLVK